MKFQYFWPFEYHLRAQDAWASSDFRTHVDIITLNGIPNRLSLWIKKYMCARRDGGRSEGYHSCRLEIDADALPSTITKLQPISINSWYETATLFISFLTCVWFLVDRFCFLQENELLKLVVFVVGSCFKLARGVDLASYFYWSPSSRRLLSIVWEEHFDDDMEIRSGLPFLRF